jgi:hypothetical protein
VVFKYGIIHYSLRREEHPYRSIAKAFVSNMGLGWTLGASWLRCLFVSDAPFVRTNKFISEVMPNAIKSMTVELALGAALLAAALIFALSDFVFGPIAALLMCGARFAIYWVYVQTRHTLAATAALFPTEEEPSEIEPNRLEIETTSESPV